MRKTQVSISDKRKILPCFILSKQVFGINHLISILKLVFAMFPTF